MAGEHKCVQVDKLADIKTQQALHTQEFAMTNSMLKEIKDQQKEMNDKIGLFLDTSNKIYMTKESAKNLETRINNLYTAIWVICFSIVCTLGISIWTPLTKLIFKG